MGKLFAHRHGWAFKVTRFPEGYPAGFDLPPGANVALYDQRGWPAVESAWAGMAGLFWGNRLALDLGLLDGSEDKFTHMFHRGRQVHKAPPRLPEEMAKHLEACKFAKADDRQLAGRLYAESFGSELRQAERIYGSNLFWGDGEARAISALLVSGALPSLVSMDLSKNAIGSEGFAALAQALSDGHAPKLEELWLEDNLEGHDGMTKLEEACKSRSIGLHR